MQPPLPLPASLPLLLPLSPRVPRRCWPSGLVLTSGLIFPPQAENIMFLELDVSPPAVFEMEFSHDQDQDPRALHMERLMRLDSFLERPSTSKVRKSRSCCQSPQWPPPPTAHASLATSTALLPTTVFDHECVRPPVPPDPRERAANPGTSLQLGVLACVCVWGGGTPAGMPLLALSLLYLINVIYSWSSVPLGKEPSPEPAMRTAQPPPLLTLDPPAPIRPHSPSGQLLQKGRRRYLWLFFLSGLPQNLHLLLCRRGAAPEHFLEPREIQGVR